MDFLKSIGKNVFGDIWSTSLGGGLIFANFGKVLEVLSRNPTVGEFITSPEVQAFVVGVVLPFLRDPKGAPQIVDSKG